MLPEGKGAMGPDDFQDALVTVKYFRPGRFPRPHLEKLLVPKRQVI